MERINESQIKNLVGKRFLVKCSDGAKFINQLLTSVDDPKSPKQFLYFEKPDKKLNIISVDKINKLAGDKFR